MTLEEAKLKAKEDNELAEVSFCPLIDRVCDIDCICWQEAKPYEIQVSLDGGSHEGRGQYKVTWVGCNNAMFSGNRECNSRY